MAIDRNLKIYGKVAELSYFIKVYNKKYQMFKIIKSILKKNSIKSAVSFGILYMNGGLAFGNMC